MEDAADLMTFAGNPLDRASQLRSDPEWIAAQLAAPDAVFLPIYRGDPLVRDGSTVFLSAQARREFPQDAVTVFLGLKNGAPHFVVDFSSAPLPQDAPFADFGQYAPIRDAAFSLPGEDMAIIGEARWFLEWHRRHLHCATCGATTQIRDGGAKRFCPQCAIEHFPRSDPVAIVLAVHGEACLMGRGPHFRPGYFSALAGYVEACETPEECAARELREEAGVTLSNVRYQFSQPWPFPSSLMMGFIADATDRALTLDRNEIVEARWIERPEILRLLDGENREDVKLPPRFTIARRLIERWAGR